MLRAKQETWENFFLCCQELQGKVKKTKLNTFRGSKYMDLPSLLKNSFNILKERQFIFTQKILVINNKNHIKTTVRSWTDPNFKIESLIQMHNASEEPKEISKTTNKDVTNLNQKIGTSITYFRRYALSTILNIMPDDDLDGETPGENKTEQSSHSTFNPNEAPF